MDSCCFIEASPEDDRGLHTGLVVDNTPSCFGIFVGNGTTSSLDDNWLRNLLSIYTHDIVVNVP